MYVNNAESVSQALSQGLHAIRVRGIDQPSRVGSVLVHPNPVLTVYHNPTNRVLFSPMRDANPFFHVMESLWMLAGRNDLPWLVQFNKQMASYSDDGGATQPGAYGYRWRNYFGYDQLETIIVELRNNPQTRRCVLAMWDGGAQWDDACSQPELNGRNGAFGAEGDLFNAISGSADVPCNTHAYFDTIDGRLNMTVCNRSNDIWWGAHGANAVHFSFLLEYVSAMTGIPMGVYRQFSNNYHLYTNVVDPKELMPIARDVDATDRYFKTGISPTREKLPTPLRHVPLINTPDSFLNELGLFMAKDDIVGYENHFFPDVATPMRRAWEFHKAKNYDEAIIYAETIRAEDWRIACIEWLRRRKQRAEVNKTPFTNVVEDHVPYNDGGENADA